MSPDLQYQLNSDEIKPLKSDKETVESIKLPRMWGTEGRCMSQKSFTKRQSLARNRAIRAV
jgi:hypothetical protein